MRTYKLSSHIGHEKPLHSSPLSSATTSIGTSELPKLHPEQEHQQLEERGMKVNLGMERKSVRFWLSMIGVSAVMAVAALGSSISSNGHHMALPPGADSALGFNVDVLARAESFTNQVRFDNYSLLVKDQRFFL
ncbi:hypothetical protein E1B28_010648 [Marasmius oreades]|uniref:Uncharacterized protein n=1 Tax=Marasmius oreades TaxID=181124 RepID=A0A9P7RY59_9AGAR|nr:uncharacterized protein E1B28_010648 [Marasmius oreades]KAG7091628.1 hypothetical protein E1B28_010648 [Marasmius oreades]